MTPGTKIHRYVLGERIGAGGTAVVYAARDGDRELAIKVLRDDSDDPAHAERLVREVTLLREVAHSALVPVVDSGLLDDGRPWIAMERLRGCTLREALADDDTLRDARALWSTMRPIAEALAVAHEAGIFHRDVKPENIFIEESGAWRLLDFGLARSSRAPKYTGTGVPIGTPAYMAPELWWNDGVTASVDQYALGVTVFECLSGRVPFEREGFVALMRAHLDDAPPSLASLGVRATDAIERWLARALSKRAEQRFPSMRAMLTAADEAFGVAVVEPRKRNAIAPLLALAGPLLCVTAGYGSIHDPRVLSLNAGWAVYPSALAFVAAFIAISLRRPLTVLHCFFALSAAFGTSSGWQAVLSAIARTPSERQFEIMQVGLYEASINSWFGAWCAASLCMASLELSRAECTVDRRSLRASALVSCGALAVALVAVFTAQYGASVVALFIAAATFVGRGATRAPSLALSRLALSLAVVSLGTYGALVRASASSALTWVQEAPRSVRALAVVATAAERSVILALALCGALSVLALHARSLELLRARGASSLALPRISLAIAALALAMELAVSWRIRSARDRAWAALAPQFAIFAKLAPPVEASLPAARVAPTVQLARDVVAIDAVPVAPLRSLANAAGRSVFVSDLSHRLARERAEQSTLALVVDREVPAERAIAVAQIALALGVTQIDLLFARGPTPTLSASAPLEALWAVPRDFGALRLELREGSPTIHARTMDELAAALLRDRARGVWIVPSSAAGTAER